jgi:hypothetical protein
MSLLRGTIDDRDVPFEQVFFLLRASWGQHCCIAGILQGYREVISLLSWEKKPEQLMDNDRRSKSDGREF